MQQEFFFHVLHEEGAAVRPRRTVKDGSNSTWTVPKRATEPGPSDGFVCEFAVAELRPGRDGKFALDVPDFANDGAARSYHGPGDRAEWSFSAWEGHTARDQLYRLTANKEAGKTPGSLLIAREYPDEILSVAQPF